MSSRYTTSSQAYQPSGSLSAYSYSSSRITDAPFSSRSSSSSRNSDSADSRLGVEQDWHLPSNWNWTGYRDNPENIVLQDRTREEQKNFPVQDWSLPKRGPRRPSPEYWEDPESSASTAILGQSNAVVGRVTCQGRVLAQKSEMINKRSPTHLQEKQILEKLKHRHIVQFIGSYITDDGLVYRALFYPVAEMDLTAFMHHGKHTNTPDWVRVMSEGLGCLSNALAYIHSAGIKHKDIKPANILVQGNIMILADFGSASNFSDAKAGSKSWGPKGMTNLYMPPEARNQRASHGRSADVFSLGLVMGEMVDYIYAPGQLSEVEKRKELARNNSRAVSYFQPQEMTRDEEDFLRYMPNYRKSLSRKDVRLLFSVMTALDPGLRPTSREVWEFFRDREFDFILGLGGVCRTCGRCCV